jgi:hypothetical protein
MTIASRSWTIGLLAILAALALPACGDDDDGAASDADTDADSDADSDADTDSDTDSDTDTDPCADLLEGCCNWACECPEENPVCVYTDDLDGSAGVCQPEPAEGDCWNLGDCEEVGEVCQGASVCPCGYDCDLDDQQGSCVPVTDGCCEAATVPDECADGYHCVEMGGADTCHALPDWPSCFVDEDCGDGLFCLGEELCDCQTYCLSEPGVCTWPED